MGRVAVVTDSTVGFPPEVMQEIQVPLIPLNVHWGDETYLDGVTLDTVTFYRWLHTRTDHPKTSQPSVGAFTRFYREVAERFQTDTIVGIYISSGLSGTVASATMAAAEVPDLHIEVVDSLTTSMGMGLLVLEAVRMAEQGATAEAIVERMYTLVPRSHVFFAVDTLEYLHRGGRIGGAARLLGTMLNIKPILTVIDGKVEAVEKVRSRRKSLKRIIEIVKGYFKESPPGEISIVYTGREHDKDADWFIEAVNRQLRPRRLHVTMLSPVIGTHTGPGTMGIAFIEGM